jgi:hypothetical protein
LAGTFHSFDAETAESAEQLMKTTFCLSILVCAAFARPAFCGLEEPEVRVTLRTNARKYLLGQTVHAHLSVMNVGKRAISRLQLFEESFHLDCEPETKRLVSTNGTEFHECPTGIHLSDFAVSRSISTIEPRQSAHIRIPILYMRERVFGTAGGGLLFHQPGTYWIKLSTPFYFRHEGDAAFHREELESNTVKIEITEPAGEASVVYEELLNVNAEMAYFLQSSLLPQDGGDIPRRAATVLRDHPKSAYANDLWEALAKYYYKTPGIKDRNERQLIRETLGFEHDVRMHVSGNVLPPDRWLDVRRMTIDGEERPLTELLDEVSQRCAVSLRVSRDIELGSAELSLRPFTLRQFMQSLVDPGRTTWIRQDGGYLLAPVPGKEGADKSDRPRAPKASPPPR